MLDKEIRKSLVLYLKQQNSDIKVFSEVKIGRSVADLMIVSDRICGYEIKSDGDNYDRLLSQVIDYDDYFDENYVVIGKTHKDTIKKYVPAYWGIILIDENGISILRDAKNNTGVKTSNKLDFLWDIEVKEVLIENGLSLCSGKDRADIERYLKAELTHGEISYAVINELKKRPEAFVKGSDCFAGNESELINMLAEQDVTLDYWISIFTEASKIKEERKKKLKEFDSREIALDSNVDGIDFCLGSPFIKPYIIDEFLAHISGERVKTATTYNTFSGIWEIDKRLYGIYTNVQLKYVYGLPDFNAIKLVESILNNRELKVYKTVDNKRKEDEQSTVALLDKAKIVNAEFKKWIYTRPDLLASIKRQYIKYFSISPSVKPDWQGMVFENMNPDFKLFDYQKEAVARIIGSNNTLVAFDVGSGKTAIMVAASMKMREQNISRKNMFVVPNSIVGQWEKMFTDIYPDARVLTISPKDFTPSKREKVIRMIKENDYDGIIIAYSCFELIPLSEKYKIDQLNEVLSKLDRGIQPPELMSYKTDYMHTLQRVREMIEHLKKAAVKRGEDLCFDRLGINSLFLDEAHNYKNLPIETSMKNVSGFNIKGSSKCQDMLDKIRCVQKQNEGRGVIFATGTPLSNSIADVYNMQMYLQPEALAQCGVARFDEWVKTFTVCEDSLELDVTGLGYRNVKKFKKFVNLDTLSSIFSQITIYYSKNQIDELPYFNGYTDIEIERSKNLSEYMMNLAGRADRIRNKEVEKTTDNMLKISTDGRKAALDLRLVDENAESGERLRECIKNVLEIYKADDYSTQVVFSDFSTPKNSFNVYDELKKMLVKNGVKEEEVAFIHDAENDRERIKLFKDINEGKVRIIIGSTFKLGIGVNIQKKLKALHHLDVPWRPADMVQREGRIIRPGNEQGEIMIFRYITKGSFDGYSWQILENKQRFISQFLSGTGYQKRISDLEENVLDYAEAKALALDEPLMKEIADTENEIGRITILKKQAEEQRIIDIEELQKTESEIHVCEEKLRAVNNSLGRYYDFSDRDMEKLKNAMINNCLVETDLNKINYSGDFILWINGFLIRGTFVNKGKKYIELIASYGEGFFYIEIGESLSGNVTRIRNFFKNIKKTIKELKKELELNKSRYDLLLQSTNRTFDYEMQLLELEEKLEGLKSSLPEMK